MAGDSAARKRRAASSLKTGTVTWQEPKRQKVGQTDGRQTSTQHADKRRCRYHGPAPRAPAGPAAAAAAGSGPAQPEPVEPESVEPESVEPLQPSCSHSAPVTVPDDGALREW